MMTEELVTIGRYADPVDARLAFNRLEEEGIEARLSGEESVGVLVGLSPSLALVELNVRAADAERALDILNQPPPREEIPEAEPETEDTPLADDPRTLVTRAHRAALLGLIVPLLLEPYATYLLLRYLLLPESKVPPELDQELSGKLTLTIAANVLGLLRDVVAVLLLGYFLLQLGKLLLGIA